jgi:hypothetical protein
MCRVSAASRKQQRDASADSQSAKQDRAYFNVTGYPFPLGPFTERRTVMREASARPCLLHGPLRPGAGSVGSCCA